MTKDEIIRMAREAGFFINDNGGIESPLMEDCVIDEFIERFFNLAFAAGAAGLFTFEQVEEHIQAATACEREACAKVCEELDKHFDYTIAARQCAAAIRARGEK